MTLEELGWSSFFAVAMPAERDVRPARVSSVHGVLVDVWTADGPAIASMRGTLRGASMEGGLAAGDWVAVSGTGQSGASDLVVEQVLPRRTVFLRQAAGERAEPQAIAANLDRVFVVTSVEGDFNVRRLERYLVAIAGGGASPVIVLTKADLLPEVEAQALVGEASRLAPTILTSARSGLGVDELRALMPQGSTSALAGSSGVGKSALVNRLLERDVQIEGDVHAHDKRGRHTTTRREMFLLPGGGVVVDTPGMRELRPWQPERPDAEDAFDDLLAIAVSCKYRDCRHRTEPGCAVREAVAEGKVAPERLAGYQKLEAERATGRGAKPRSRR